MIACRRCGRERPTCRKRGLCTPCRTHVWNTGRQADYPPLLPPLPVRPRANRRAPLGDDVRREIARLHQRGYGCVVLARAYECSRDAVCKAVAWLEAREAMR